MNELLARLRSALEGMSPRERMLVGGAGTALALLLAWLVVVQPLLSAASRAEQRVETAQRELEVVNELRARYDAVNGRLASVEQRIANGPRGEIFTLLENLARQSAVKVDSMEPRTSPASDDYRETKVLVALKSVTLAQLVNYLHRIEAAEQLLSVKSLRIRSRGEGQQLDVTFTVSSFEPA